MPGPGGRGAARKVGEPVLARKVGEPALRRIGRRTCAHKVRPPTILRPPAARPEASPPPPCRGRSPASHVEPLTVRWDRDTCDRHIRILLEREGHPDFACPGAPRVRVCHHARRVGAATGTNPGASAVLAGAQCAAERKDGDRCRPPDETDGMGACGFSPMTASASAPGHSPVFRTSQSGNHP